MTETQKNNIINFRMVGMSYLDIALKLKISKGSIQSFCRRNNIQIKNCSQEAENKNLYIYCLNCGKKLSQQEKQKPKKFCSDKCRLSWWKSNREKIKKNAIYPIKCKYCGKKFESYGNKDRKFCCHEHYILSRFLK